MPPVLDPEKISPFSDPHLFREAVRHPGGIRAQAQLLLRHRHREALAPTATSRCDDLFARGALHPRTEAVFVETLAIAGLIRALHFRPPGRFPPGGGAHQCGVVPVLSGGAGGGTSTPRHKHPSGVARRAADLGMHSSNVSRHLILHRQPLKRPILYKFDVPDRHLRCSERAQMKTSPTFFRPFVYRSSRVVTHGRPCR